MKQKVSYFSTTEYWRFTWKRKKRGAIMLDGGN